MNINIPINYGGVGRTASDMTSKPAATPPSESVEKSLDARRTEALIPSELSPVGTGAESQEVTSDESQVNLLEAYAEKSEKANEYLQQAGTHLQFNVSEQTGRIIVTVINTDTEEVVRTIPPEMMDKFADQASKMRGLLFNKAG